ncbi:c-type cytochrome [Hymenobacter telluris]|nr:cytochrome c [Hymenobacter telluris]
MSNFSLKMMLPLLVVVLVFTMGGIFFAATGLVTPLADADAARAATDKLALAEQSLCAGSGGDSTIQSLENRPPVSPEQAVAIAAGDALFKGNCAQCHAVNDVVVGPALAGLHKRRPVSWLIPWIKNSSKVVASGDEYAVKLFNQYQKQQMPSFALSDQEIRQILAYLEVESNSGMTKTSAVALN